MKGRPVARIPERAGRRSIGAGIDGSQATPLREHARAMLRSRATVYPPTS